MARRGDVLELAVLGLLHESPMHGYQLRKQLSYVLGTFRALSFGSLYPALRRLTAAGYIDQIDDKASGQVPPLAGRRARIVYQLTSAGKEHFMSTLGATGTQSWEDDQFDVRFAFFSWLDSSARLRILEGRRARIQERLEQLRASIHKTQPRLDRYGRELQRHGLESVEGELKWLERLIVTERAEANSEPDSGPSAKSTTPK